MEIDKTTYLKTRFPLRHGYDRRSPGVRPTAIIVHSTSNASRNTSFQKEAEYIYKSATISAHYLIGKGAAQGVVQFLPDTYRAWHAGQTIPGWGNNEAVGIELHISVGEQPTDYQITVLADLVRELMQTWDIPESGIDTHRAVARPLGRKRDPEGWPDPSFYNWRSVLTPASDPWALWGDEYPLPVEQRHYGIPSLWYENRRWLKEARTPVLYPLGSEAFVIQLFQGGFICCQDGVCQVKQLPKKLP